MTPSPQHTLLKRMRSVIDRHGDRVAVHERRRTYSYTEFGELIARIWVELDQHAPDSRRPIGILLDRSALAYATMWAAIGHGRAYVPLNSSYPDSRLRDIASQAGLGSIVCLEQHRRLALSLGIHESDVVVPASDACLQRRGSWWSERSAGDIAYVLFTSGSTGKPKGVPISYSNLVAFVDNMTATIDYMPQDVCSQVCELSFDFSVHEIYLALLNGCALCPAERTDLFNPARYIQSRSISVWIAVPSLARVILNNGVAIDDALDSIRISIFNGEALTASTAEAWHDVTPHAQLWNTYGPTECTVAVTAQRWKPNAALEEAGVVAIGSPFPDCKLALLAGKNVVPIDESTHDTSGELLLATPQCFAGYTDSTLPSPFIVDQHGATYYRTGDRVLAREGRLFHLGRIDLQVKIGGHRIELLEIEHRLRVGLEEDSLAVIASPATQPTELVLFVTGSVKTKKLDSGSLGLPSYMLPKRTIFLESLPTNAHGKLDRRALQFLAENGR